MDQDTFSDRIRAFAQRTVELRQRSDQRIFDRSSEMPSALDEMQIALEELRVAEEELRTQNEELAISQLALERERQRYHELFDFAPDSYIVTDATGIIQETNQAAQALLGGSQYGLMGKPLVVYIARDNRPAFYALLQQLAEKPEKQTWEAGIRSPTGTPIPSHFTVVPMWDPAHATRGLRWLIRDITPHVQMTERLQALNAELETRVQQRTATLQRSNEELQQFAYVVSHDLQEPLRTVRTYVQLLASRLQSVLDAEAEEFLGFAVEGTQRMQNLISDLLTYSRVQAPERRLVETDCEQILTGVLTDLQGAISDAGAVVTHDPLPAVLTDAPLLSQVFQNLLNNALKFRGQQPLRIHVSAVREGDEWIFSVRDNGIGLDPKYAERIFVIFQRLHAPQKYPGTGIGLAICKKIIGQHGGRIGVQSTPGAGATFYFTLPVRAREDKA